MTLQTAGVTVSTLELAQMLSCSDRHIPDMDKEGKLPAPVRFGNLKRWIRADIDLWLTNGCPDRQGFTSLKAKA